MRLDPSVDIRRDLRLGAVSARSRILALGLAWLVASCGGEETDPPADERPATPLVFPEEPFRAMRPAAGTMAPFQPPQPETFRLDNGMQVFLVERRTIPFVSWQLALPVGSMVDPPGKEGLTSLCLNVSFQASKFRNRDDREQILADLGAEVGLSAGVTSLVWTGQAPQAHLEMVAQLWMELFLDPALEQRHFDGTLGVRLNSLMAGASQTPGAIAARVSSRLYWGPEHPYNRQITPASLQRITLADCRDLFVRAVQPVGAKLYVAGAVNRAELLMAFSRLPLITGPMPIPVPPPPAAPAPGRMFFVHAPGAPQSIITLRGPGPARGAPEYYPAELMGAILAGDSINSRIGKNLREMRGFAYSVGGGFGYSEAGGFFSFSAPVRTDATSESVFEVLEEIRKLRESGVTSEELETERRGRVAGLPYLFETAGSTLAQYDSLDSYGIPFDYFATYAQRFQTVTAAAVQAMAVQHLAPEALKVLVVGDGPSVLPKLRTLAAMRPEVMGGEVIVLDSEGRPTASP